MSWHQALFILSSASTVADRLCSLEFRWQAHLATAGTASLVVYTFPRVSVHPTYATDMYIHELQIPAICFYLFFSYCSLAVRDVSDPRGRAWTLETLSQPAGRADSSNCAPYRIGPFKERFLTDETYHYDHKQSPKMYPLRTSTSVSALLIVTVVYWTLQVNYRAPAW